MSDVEFVKDEDKIVCFVNSVKPPNSVKRLSIYKYIKNDQNNITFYELCEYEYIHEEIMSYTALTWEAISVPKYKESVFLLVCDAMKALSI